MSKANSANNSVPVARLLSVENQVHKLTTELEKLILISTQHGTRIKELIVAASNSVSQVEMMSTVTTTRFQHMNDLKSLRMNLQAKYEQLSQGGVVDHGHEEMEGKDTKALTSKINDVQNEISNSNFKTNMEMNKLRMELKASKKDYDELKKFVTVLETKLGALIQDAKDSGIKTSIQMDDMPEITYQPSGTARRASILNPDAGMPTTPQSAGGRRPSVMPGNMTPFGGTPGPQPHGYDAHMYPMQPGPFYHLMVGPDGAGPSPGQPFPAFPFPGMPMQFPMPGQHMDAQQMQQLQLAYQQQVYAHQHQHHHSNRGSVYVPGMPMTDSGLSTEAHTPGGGSPSAHPMAAMHFPFFAAASHGYGDPAAHGAAGAAGGGSGGDGYTHMSAAHRILHPHGHFPGGNGGYFFPPYGHYGHYGHHMPAAVDTDAQLLQGLGGPTAAPLSKEEKYYKAQFRAIKELIMASMECKDLATLEPPDLHTAERHHREESVVDSSADGTAHAAQNSGVSGGLGGDGNGTSGSGGSGDGSGGDGGVPAEPEVPTRRELLAKFDMRHRNRDLYRNLRKVKETEKIAMNYADFVVTNAINLVDEGAYQTFKRKLADDHFGRLNVKPESTEASVQTENDKINSGGGSGSGGGAESSMSTQQHVGEQGSGQPSSPAGGQGGMSDSLQKLRQTRQQDAGELDLLAQLALNGPTTKLDFGEKLEPTLVQYSSTGRRQSLLQMGCVFEEDLRDPALRFLETTLEEGDSDGDDDSGTETSDHDGAHGGTHSKPSSRGSVSRSPSFTGSPATGSRPSMRKLSSFPSATIGRKPSSAQNRPISARKFIASESEHVDFETLRTELTALMDRKLLKLYEGLDDRWKGLDETNLSILQKLGRFQEALQTVHGDNQKLQVTTQLLAQRLAKTDARIFDAMEPVYLALDAQKQHMNELEGLLVDVARQLRHIESGERPVPTEVASQAELMSQYRKEQVPIDLLLKNSRRVGYTDWANPTSTTTATAHNNGDTQDGYRLEGFSAPVPAISNMSEHELELILRQLKEYASLYEDMVHNYERINERLREEDMRKSGNFSLKKPHITRTKPVKPPATTIREIINTPMAPPWPLDEPAVVEKEEPDPETQQRHSAHKEVVVHMPHTPQASIAEQAQEHEGFDEHAHEDNQIVTVSPNNSSPSAAVPSSTSAAAAPLGSQTGPPRTKRPNFASPHRVLTEPFYTRKPASSNQTTSPPSLAARMGPLTKRDLLQLVENSDLSANVEIIRIKNELARLKTALYRRDATSPTARQGGQQAPALFPSLFSGLDSAGFTVAKTQVTSPTGSMLRSKSPQSRSGRTPEPQRPVLAGALFPAGERPVTKHLVVASAPPRSAAQPQRPPTTPSRHARPPSVQFQDTLSSAAGVMEVEPEGTPGAVSATNSVVVPPHLDSPIAPEVEGSYHPSAAEDEDGLHEDSLSAYDFLLHPSTQQRSDGLGSVDVMDRPAVQQSQEAVINSVAVSASGVSSGETIRQSEPRGSLWGSANAIGHTKLNAKVHPPAALTSTQRASLLSPRSGGGGSSGGGGGGGGGVGASTPTNSAATRAVEMAQRAEAIAIGEMKTFTLDGSVKTANIPTPSPPVKSRPTVVKSEAAAGASSMRPTPTRPTAGPASAASATATNKTNHSNSRGRQGEWTNEQVWQRDYGSVESLSGTIASTPSIVLQGGEFVPDLVDQGVPAGSLVFGMSAGIAGFGGSVDSLPANDRRNMGENAFD